MQTSSELIPRNRLGFHILSLSMGCRIRGQNTSPSQKLIREELMFDKDPLEVLQVLPLRSF